MTPQSPFHKDQSPEDAHRKILADSDFQDFAQSVRDDLLPKLQGSAVVMSLLPKNPRSDVDIKYAIELGMSILLDKPLVVVVRPGTEVPEHLIRCADRIVEMDLNDPEGTRERMHQVIVEMGLG